MNRSEILELMDELAISFHRINKVCEKLRENESEISLCEPFNGRYQLDNGIALLAAAAGQEIIVNPNDSQFYPCECSFEYKGVTFFTMEEKLSEAGDNQ